MSAVKPDVFSIYFEIRKLIMGAGKLMKCFIFINSSAEARIASLIHELVHHSFHKQFMKVMLFA